MGDKQRIIELQRQVRIARKALEKIHGHCAAHEAYSVAEEALYCQAEGSVGVP